MTSVDGYLRSISGYQYWRLTARQYMHNYYDSQSQGVSKQDTLQATRLDAVLYCNTSHLDGVLTKYNQPHPTMPTSSYHTVCLRIGVC